MAQGDCHYLRKQDGPDRLLMCEFKKQPDDMMKITIRCGGTPTFEMVPVGVELGRGYYKAFMKDGWEASDEQGQASGED